MVARHSDSRATYGSNDAAAVKSELFSPEGRVFTIKSGSRVKTVIAPTPGIMAEDTRGRVAASRQELAPRGKEFRLKSGSSVSTPVGSPMTDKQRKKWLGNSDDAAALSRLESSAKPDHKARIASALASLKALQADEGLPQPVRDTAADFGSKLTLIAVRLTAPAAQQATEPEIKLITQAEAFIAAQGESQKAALAGAEQDAIVEDASGKSINTLTAQAADLEASADDEEKRALNAEQEADDALAAEQVATDAANDAALKAQKLQPKVKRLENERDSLQRQLATAEDNLKAQASKKGSPTKAQNQQNISINNKINNIKADIALKRKELTDVEKVQRTWLNRSRDAAMEAQQQAMIALASDKKSKQLQNSSASLRGREADVSGKAAIAAENLAAARQRNTTRTTTAAADKRAIADAIAQRKWNGLDQVIQAAIPPRSSKADKDQRFADLASSIVDAIRLTQVPASAQAQGVAQGVASAPVVIVPPNTPAAAAVVGGAIPAQFIATPATPAQSQARYRLVRSPATAASSATGSSLSPIAISAGSLPVPQDVIDRLVYTSSAQPNDRNALKTKELQAISDTYVDPQKTMLRLNTGGNNQTTKSQHAEKLLELLGYSK